MQTLYGRVAVVVAGSDGVGAAIARCFGELGASVVVNYASDKAGAERVVAKIVRSGGRAIAFQSDMANEADFGNAVSCACLNFGNPEFVINNTRDYLQDASAPRPEEAYLSDLRGYFAQAAGRESRIRGRSGTYRSGEHVGRTGCLDLARTRTAHHGHNRSCQGIFATASARPAQSDGSSQRDGSAYSLTVTTPQEE